MLPLAAVWAAAAAGAVLGVAALTGDDAPDRSRATAAEVAGVPAGSVAHLGDRMRTSYGIASVGGVVNVTGPDYAMGLRLRPGDRVYQASLTMINLRRAPVVVGPSLITLDRSRALGAVTIATGTATGGRIPALSAHDYPVRFALAAGSPLPRLHLRDPATRRVTTVDLGGTQGLPTLALGEHHPAPNRPTGGQGR